MVESKRMEEQTGIIPTLYRTLKIEVPKDVYFENIDPADKENLQKLSNHALETHGDHSAALILVGSSTRSENYDDLDVKVSPTRGSSVDGANQAVNGILQNMLDEGHITNIRSSIERSRLGGTRNTLIATPRRGHEIHIILSDADQDLPAEQEVAWGKSRRKRFSILGEIKYQ